MLWKCERLSAETGCYLYIAGQHVNAKYGFYNYSSPRVRREAKDMVTEIQNSFNVMFATLLSARRVDAMELSRQAEQSKADLKTAQDEIAVQRAYIEQLEADLLRQQQTIT